MQKKSNNQLLWELYLPILKKFPNTSQKVSTTLTKFIRNNSLSGHALNESDINRLARNDTDQAHAIVKTKDDARTTGVPIANTTDTSTDSTT